MGLLHLCLILNLISPCDVTKDTCATPDGDGKREIAYPTLSSNEICIHQDVFYSRNLSTFSFKGYIYYMPRVRSQYIAEMRERFEVVDRVKATSEEKASLTKAIEDEQRSSPEVTPSKESTLPKDKADAVKLKFAVEEEDEEEKVEIEEVEENEENDVESGIKVSSFLGFLISILYASNNPQC